MKNKTERIRDPIHDIIIFDRDLLLDSTTWNLLQTPDVQRLRRIKQLGVSEFVFPAATHTRFAHSIGVFQNARRLINLIRREIQAGRASGEFDEDRAKVAAFAALLHDAGHGPFSHAFEEARKALADSRSDGAVKPKIRKHESFTAEIIEDPGSQIGSILIDAGTDPKDVANLIRAETPTDMYHAIVSSSFDADRLDYLVRDRYMTGTGVGSIDISWLMDNIRVAEIDVGPAEADGGKPIYSHSFCLGYKARDAAEYFLLARYRLYTNVYFHKTTRGIEQLISALFRHIASFATEKLIPPGLYEDHPLTRFFYPEGENILNYRDLDDTVVWSAIHDIARRGDARGKDLASRILERRKPMCLDVQLAYPEDAERQRRLKHRLDEIFKAQLGNTVFRDVAKLSLYGEIGADDGRAQKRLMIQLADGNIKEITDFRHATVAASDRERPFERYYFLDESDFRKAETAVDSVRGKRA